MAQSLYWYDLETSGTEVRWDRIVQFAGFRTDLDLNPVGDEYCAYVVLPDDVLPDPQATLVTGITPDLTRREGLSEFEVLDRVRQLFSVPGTCVAGFNSLRFDDEFIRYGFYRMMMDPYAREWQNDNSRWDIIDLVRATGALRRDGIVWPSNEEGLPTYRLEDMTRANGLDHGQAHDALSDVRATVAVARMIRDAQPRLYEYYFNLRRKKSVKKLLEPYGARMLVHVSGMYPRERYCTAPVVSLCRHPTNSNSVIVVDLGQDVEPLLRLSEEEIREKLFTPGPSPDRPPLKEVKVNRCPFLAGMEVLDDENWSRLGLKRTDVEKRQRRLKQPGLAQKIMRVFSGRKMDRFEDPDAALYDAFLQDADRARCESFLEAVRAGGWCDLDYVDKRLHTLAARLKARSFPDLQSAAEADDWRHFVTGKLRAENVPWRTLGVYFEELQRTREALEERPASGAALEIVDALTEHGRMLETRYPVSGAA
ncbi:MAG: exodeoxyribonuclease I [Pseudomonadales bacterium]|jgi:exodeoxyribonuclease-1